MNSTEIVACVNMAQRAMEANGETLAVTVDVIEDGAHVRINTDPVSLVLPRVDAMALCAELYEALHDKVLPPYDR